MQRNRGKKTEWERLEISSRKLEITREYFMQRWTIKDRNGMDLTEVEDIKKKWQEYTEELYKKDIHDTEKKADKFSLRDVLTRLSSWNSTLHDVVFMCSS